jgi:hypothetical protein
MDHDQDKIIEKLDTHLIKNQDKPPEKTYTEFATSVVMQGRKATGLR